MKRNQRQSGFVALPDTVKLTAESESGPHRKITITALKLSDEKAAEKLIPLFVLSEAGKPKMVVEISRFSQSFGSWLIVPDDVSLVPEVCSNGDMTFVTRVDPLFPALALMDCLRHVTGKEMFQPLNAICVTSDGTNLANLCEEDQFSMICDVKEAAGNKYYRLNNEKATAWLAQKHTTLLKQLSGNSESAAQILSQYLTVTFEALLSKSICSSLQTNPSTVPVPQKGQDLAMAIMMEDAKETNRAKRALQGTNNSNSFKTRTTRNSSTKKTRNPSAKVSNFWDSMKSSQGS